MTTVGQYSIEREIAQGGFGRIFLAKHKELGEYAVLKQNIDATPESVELLRNEAKILWKLNEYHSIPHAKDFFNVGKDNYVLVMDHIEGKTLEELVESKGPLHPEDACWITERLLGALHYSHHNGIVHCDVKPGNIIVEEKKHDVKLIDWGLAAYKPTRTSVPTGMTPAYAAPEVLEGKPPIPETDLYGAGMCMLYALGGDPRTKSLADSIPKPLSRFCESLLLYDPAARPNWQKEDLVKRLSDIRQDVFGRRHRSGKS